MPREPFGDRVHLWFKIAVLTERFVWTEGLRPRVWGFTLWDGTSARVV